MADFQFKMPDVGEGVVEAEIVAWRVKAGDVVAEDDPVVDVMTDKATVEIPSPVTGRVVATVGAPGDVLPVGSVILTIEVEGGDRAAGPLGPVSAKPQESRALAPLELEAGEVSAPEPEIERGLVARAAPPAVVERNAVAPLAAAPIPPLVARDSRPLASPAVRQRALDGGIDLAHVPGSGPAGRVTHQDLDDFIASGGRLAVYASARAGAPIKARRTGVEPVKLIGLRRKIAENMARSKRSIPHFAYVEEVDVTALEALRKHLNAAKRPDQTKLTLLPFLAQAMVKVLPEFPNANATFDDEAGVLTKYEAVHLGIAAATPNGLMVPVLRHAEALDIWETAAEIARLAEAAKAGKATKEELSGSTITITSLGTLGGIVSTPVINAPEVAIIGVNKMVDRPVVLDGQIVVRTMMNLSSSFDHRIVDGQDAASLIQRLKARLEQPATIFM